MKNKNEITVKISVGTYKKILDIKKKTGASIRWIIDSAISALKNK